MPNHKLDLRQRLCLCVDGAQRADRVLGLWGPPRSAVPAGARRQARFGVCGLQPGRPRADGRAVRIFAHDAPRRLPTTRRPDSAAPGAQCVGAARWRRRRHAWRRPVVGSRAAELPHHEVGHRGGGNAVCDDRAHHPGWDDHTAPHAPDGASPAVPCPYLLSNRPRPLSLSLSLAPGSCNSCGGIEACRSLPRRSWRPAATWST